MSNEHFQPAPAVVDWHSDFVSVDGLGLSHGQQRLLWCAVLEAPLMLSHSLCWHFIFLFCDGDGIQVIAFCFFTSAGHLASSVNLMSSIALGIF